MFFEENAENQAITRIQYAKQLLDEQEEVVKKEEYVKNLLKEDYVNTVRSFKTRYDYVEIFKDAHHQIGKKLKKERPQLETLKSYIMEDFLNNDKAFKLTDIISCGYEGYAWHIEFEGYGKKFYIAIPIKKKLYPENIVHANNGMFAFILRESDSYMKVLEQSYKIEDISNFIKEYFELKTGEERKNA